VQCDLWTDDAHAGADDAAAFTFADDDARADGDALRE